MEKIFLEGKHKQLLQTLLRNRVRRDTIVKANTRAQGIPTTVVSMQGGLASDGGFRTEWEGRK